MDSAGAPRYKMRMNKQRMIPILLAAVAGLILAGVFAYFAPKQAPQDANPLMAVTEDAFGGPFTMTDHNGKTVTEKDFAGQYRLIFFGFTYCPAICPTELAKITKVMQLLGDKAKDVHPIYVTVDPERDTPAKMKNYVEMFHPSITGLTGTAEQTKAITKAYKIYYAKVDDPKLSEYTMDHSSFTYFLGPDDRLLHIFKLPDTAEQMADIVSRWISEEKSSN